MAPTCTYRFYVTGLVQGVGFRPYIYNACMKRKLRGYVMNVGGGVIIVANEKQPILDILEQGAPGARIDSVSMTYTKEACTSFEIRKSTGTGAAEVPADTAPCDSCVRELFDPNNRRYGYFFITCTHCGPRFTITRRAPYDRHTTTMASFLMCEACRAEYEDPTNRRYHAQTIACHACGPVMRLYHNTTLHQEGTGRAIVATLARILREGAVVSVKGVGGYHLMCLTRPDTVKSLKTVTHRTDKPFAVVCKDIVMAQSLADIPPKEQELLLSRERPIVICQKRTPLSEVTELDSVGIMLPNTPLHHLLFEQITEPLILTSSNLSGDPITTTRDQQFVPWVLEHTREIVHTTDDSLVKPHATAPRFIRRSRGYTPRHIAAPSTDEHTILALGAEMNSTFSLYAHGTITPSQYLGNTAHVAVLENYERTLEMFLEYTGAKPTRICTDIHPLYATTELGTRLAERFGADHVRVQHHRAHAYSIAVEHALSDFVAIICDGTGFGDDGTVWGGEVFHNNTRIGHLEQHLLLGGDVATRYPTRIAYAILRTFLSHSETTHVLGSSFSDTVYRTLDKQWHTRLNAIPTSSCGRVLDAAAALLGICTERTYEGRPALLLESAGTTPYPLAPVVANGVLYTTPLFQFLVRNRERDTGRLAATVEQYLAEGLYELTRTYDEPLLFGGGCAYNRRMATYLTGKGAHMNKEIPPGDGGISIGQIGSVLASRSVAR